MQRTEEKRLGWTYKTGSGRFSEILDWKKASQIQRAPDNTKFVKETVVSMPSIRAGVEMIVSTITEQDFSSLTS